MVNVSAEQGELWCRSPSLLLRRRRGGTAETNDEEYLHHPEQHGVQAEEASRTLTS
jgi:hypothetical protein